MPTRLDIMREFARATGVKINEGDFIPVTKLADAVEKKRIQLQTAPRKSTPQNAGFGLAESEQKIRDLFEAYNAGNKSLSKSWYLRVSPAEIADAGQEGLLLTEKPSTIWTRTAFDTLLSAMAKGESAFPDKFPLRKQIFLKFLKLLPTPMLWRMGQGLRLAGRPLFMASP